MSTALATTTEAPIVTADQVALIKQTVASGATDAELKLYLFDCARQGVHPLDRLIHFTKRGGKYTPITSIDFMRTRAADTGEYAGSDDAQFLGGFDESSKPEYPRLATVTVWRFVQGQKCSFTATARWSEYCPAQGQDHMWRKMPHTMLAKCAEALALRKGFPRQLAGLYAKEELDQATENTATYIVEAPRGKVAELGDAAPVVKGPVASVAPTPADHAGSSPALATTDDVPNGGVYITSVSKMKTRNKNVFRYDIGTERGSYNTIKEQLAALCEEVCQTHEPVILESKDTQWGKELVSVHRVKPAAPDDLDGPVDVDSIPF